MSQTKLHFTRVRAKEEPMFFDPATDIRRLLPAVAKATLMCLQDTYEDNKTLLEDFVYLHKCFCIMQIRLAEDAMPCADQMTAFFEAINKVPKSHLFMWLQTMNVLMLTVYGMFYRRDAKADKEALKCFMDTAQFVGLRQHLSTESVRSMSEDLRRAGRLDASAETFDTNGSAVCDETGQVIENIKDLAGIFIAHSGGGTWRDLAEACDKEFSNGAVNDDRAMIALGLAYPDYNAGGLTLEVADEPAREVEEVEKT